MLERVKKKIQVWLWRLGGGVKRTQKARNHFLEQVKALDPHPNFSQIYQQQVMLAMAQLNRELEKRLFASLGFGSGVYQGTSPKRRPIQVPLVFQSLLGLPTAPPTPAGLPGQTPHQTQAQSYEHFLQDAHSLLSAQQAYALLHKAALAPPSSAASAQPSPPAPEPHTP